jgi:hypothetical protein
MAASHCFWTSPESSLKHSSFWFQPQIALMEHLCLTVWHTQN